MAALDRLEEMLTPHTRRFAPVTVGANGIHAAGCRALAGESNAMARALARTVAAKRIRVDTINPGKTDVVKPRFSPDPADAEKASSAVPMCCLRP